MMNKKKRIKELEERVAQLEQRVEMLAVCPNTWYWYPMGPDYLLWREPDDTQYPCTPVYTLGGTIVGKIGQCPIP